MSCYFNSSGADRKYADFITGQLSFVGRIDTDELFHVILGSNDFLSKESTAESIVGERHLDVEVCFADVVVFSFCR